MASTTRLTKPVFRLLVLETRSAHGEFVISITAEGIYYRQKGRRTKYLLPHGHAFLQAAKLAADARRAERKTRRRSRSLLAGR